MDELSLHILDVSENSLGAGAKHVRISITEESTQIEFSVEDDGCGMTEEQLGRLRDPAFTTKRHAGGGLGIPSLASLCERTGGVLEVHSVPESEGAHHGTVVRAVIPKTAIDSIPLGDMVGTVAALIAGGEGVRFSFVHKTDDGTVSFDTDELRPVLGDVSSANPEVLVFIKRYLSGQYDKLIKKQI